jgi:putative ABC transport system permease protein
MNLWRDLRFGFRLWRKNYGFALIAALTLALGIGATTAIFSMIYATLFEPMPYPDPDRIVVLWSKVNGFRNVVSAGDFQDWQQQSTSLEAIASANGESFNLAMPGSPPEMIDGGRSTPGLYDKVFGERPWKGRYFLPEESQAGKDHVVIITHRFWERMGSSPNVLGTQLRLNGEPYTIIGVRPPGQPDRMQGDIFAPLTFKPEQLNHDFHWLLVFGRLKPRASLAQAQSDMNAVAGRIAKAYPVSNKGWGISVEPLHNDFLPPEVIKTMWLLMAAVGFVLLIACVNVANLLLARGTTRQREVAVRASLGASRKQVFAQLMSESLVLAVIGGTAGIALAVVMIKVFLFTMPQYTLPSEANVRLSLPVLLFTLVTTMLAGMIFGCVPAWQVSKADLNETLKEGSRALVGSGRHALRRTLVIVEFALALALLAGAGLAIHSFWNLARVNPGFRTDHLLTFDLPVPQGRLTTPQQMISFYQQLQDKVQSLPGVISAGVGNGMPLTGPRMGMPFSLQGQEVADPSSRPGAGYELTTPGYYRTIGIEMAQGRAFTDDDRSGSVRVAMVNQAFADKYLKGMDPLKQRLMIEELIPGVAKLGPVVPWQIVGVYRNVHNSGVRDDGSPEIDIPFWQTPWPQAAMIVRTSSNPEAMTKSIAAVVHSLDPDLPLANTKSMDQIAAESLVGDRFVSSLYGTFAFVALLLAGIGIYGVMAFMVAQRTHEIGIRIALGADQKQVLQIILKEGLKLAVIGLGIGLVGACVVGRAMRSTLYGVGSVDATAFAAVAMVLLASAMLACYVPARRAAKVDPMVALRYE